MKPHIFEKYEAAQPRIERNGYATGNAAQKIKFGVLSIIFKAQNAIRLRHRCAAWRQVINRTNRKGIR